MEQRTTEWYNARIGKFTASEIHKLMGIKGIGETGKTYAFEKAVETVFGIQDDTFISYDMQKGIDTEPLAFAKFQELKDLEFISVNQCGFFSLDEHSGSSPDGLVGDNAILEIKCPKIETFAKVVATNEVDKKYFYQMQKQMRDTGRKNAHFFNYIIIDGKEYFHEIVVHRCDKTIDIMDIRMAEAIELKKEFINKLNTNKQWN